MSNYDPLNDRKPAPLPPLGGGNVTPGLRSLLGRLKTYVVDWKFSFVPAENAEYEPGIDREVSELGEANIVSSERKDAHTVRNFDPRKPLDQQELVPRHAVLLDIDYPAHLVASSTPGHSHLYLEVPGGVGHRDYMELLALLAKCGVIEQGYAEVSIKRGHSDLRLPWVTKADQKLHTNEPKPGEFEPVRQSSLDDWDLSPQEAHP